jgi:hypothetical protein
MRCTGASSVVPIASSESGTCGCRRCQLLQRCRARPHVVPTDQQRTFATDCSDGRAAAWTLGEITNVVFQGNEVVTSSVNATVKRWRVGANVESSGITTMTGPVNKLRLLREGWAASVSDRTFVLAAASSHSIRLALGHPIADIAVSLDERYVAVAGLDELVVLDRGRDSLATVHHPGGYLACVQFISINELAACDTSAILTLRLDLLNFFSMNSDSRTGP